MKLINICLGLLLVLNAIGQSNLVSGPMLGQVDYRSAIIWAEFKPGTMDNIYFWSQNNPSKKTLVKPVSLQNAWVGPVKYYCVGLEPETTYEYAFENSPLKNKIGKTLGSFSTKVLWQWRKAAPDFSFLAGSCAYVNNPPYDRPGKPYGGDSSIFETMAKEKASLMMWLGDTWYTREVDYGSEYGLYSRASSDRKIPVIQNFLKAMPHYAIWDDHDFGPNDIDKSYIFKEISKKVFDSYFANPTSGENGQGVYTKINYNDVDFFMLDDRWFRSNDKLKDTINGVSNPDKTFYGKQQMDWLKNALLSSNNTNTNFQTGNASFKIICTGGQVLNPVSPFDKLADFKADYNELMQFIKDYKINGVVFLTGDRHHTEIIKVNQPNFYPLYDITVSPLTSGSHSFSGPEKDNPFRVLGVDKIQNYGSFQVTGKPGERVLTVNIKDKAGNQVATYSINQKELKPM